MDQYIRSQQPFDRYIYLFAEQLECVTKHIMIAYKIHGGEVNTERLCVVKTLKGLVSGYSIHLITSDSDQSIKLYFETHCTTCNLATRIPWRYVVTRGMSV